MSVNKNTGSSWEERNPSDKPADDQSHLPSTSGLAKSGLSALFSLPSMTSDSRNLKIVADTTEQLTELYKRIQKSTTTELQLRIIPEIENMTPSISSVLPGICFYREIGGVMYVMGALFSNRDLTISSEYIRVLNPSQGNINQTISAPLTPANYANQSVGEALKTHYQRNGEGKGITAVTIINMVVVDLEMLEHPEAGDPKDRPHAMAQYLAAAWEEALLVKIPQEMASSNQPVPSPFAKKETPYGKDGTAEARVTAINGRVTVGRTLSPANMEVVVSTMNSINNQNQFGANSKEIARVTATVSLNAQAYSAYQQQMQASSMRGQQDALQRMMNMTTGIYPNNWRPLAPAITIEEASAGEMMDYNQGLHPFFFGLYTLMATNNNFVFMEALRKHSVGARGNLAALELRIDEMLQGMGSPQGRLILNDKNISDTDLVNNWIRQNVSPHATFQVNINPCGPHASIQNFLTRLAHPKNRKEEVQTLIAVIDAQTGGAFSTNVAANIQSKTGWNPSMAVLHRTPTITVNGLAEYGNKKLNTQELDEMMLCHIKGKGGIASIQQFLATQYGVTGEDPKARSQKLRIELSQSVFDGAVHINNFAQTHIWDPQFMAVFGQSMDAIGTLNVANNLGSFRSNNLVYAMGGGLATYASVGSSNPSGANIGANFSMQQAFG